MLEINLLTPEYKKKIYQEKINFKMFLYSLLLLAIFLFSLFALIGLDRFVLSHLKLTESEINQKENEIKTFSEIEDKANKLKETLKLISDLEKKKVPLVPILKELAASTPSSVQITSLTITGEKSPALSISGLAPSQKEIAKFQGKLESSERFSKVTFLSAGLGGEKDKPVFNFQLQADLEKKND